MNKQVNKLVLFCNKNRAIIFLSILGLILRLYLATLPAFKYDIGSFFYWAIRLSDTPFNKFYSPEIFTDYTPGYLYILALLGHLKLFFDLSDAQFTYLLKLPSIFAEIILGYLVFYVAQKKHLSHKICLTFAASIFFNPGLIFNSSIWGQVDAVFTLAMVFSIFFLTQKKYLFSAVLLAISFLIKPQTVAIFPVYVLFALKNFEIKQSFSASKNWLKFLVLFFVTILVFAFPFFNSNPFLQLAQKIMSTADEYKFTALGPYNLWGIIGYWIDDTKNYFYGVTYQHWGEILLLVFWLITGFFFYRRNLPLYTMAALANLAFFFLPTRVHERYLYPALVFLIFAAIELKSELLLYLQDILSVIYFLNLYQIYVYYNETTEGGKQVLMIPSVYNFLSENVKIMSIVTTCFFVGLWVYLLIRGNVQKT